MATKIDVSLDQGSALQFRRELLVLIEQSCREPNWDRHPQGIGVNDFSRYPCLAKYLQGIRIHHGSSPPPPRFAWIRFPAKGGAYSPDTMVDALRLILQKKTGKKYADLHRNAKLDQLHLVVYFNKGLIHNSPFIAPGFGLEQVATAVAPVLQNDHGALNKVFLFNAIKQELQVLQLWP